MRRRAGKSNDPEPVRLGMAAIVVVALLLAGCDSSADAADRRPNIPFLLADDLGWAAIGYHESDTLTPNIDRLADGGVKLEQHYVWPACSPTAFALPTGREPSRFGVLIRTG